MAKTGKTTTPQTVTQHKAPVEAAARAHQALTAPAPASSTLSVNSATTAPWEVLPESALAQASLPDDDTDVLTAEAVNGHGGDEVTTGFASEDEDAAAQITDRLNSSFAEQFAVADAVPADFSQTAIAATAANTTTTHPVYSADKGEAAPELEATEVEAQVVPLPAHAQKLMQQKRTAAAVTAHPEHSEAESKQAASVDVAYTPDPATTTTTTTATTVADELNSVVPAQGVRVLSRAEFMESNSTALPASDNVPLMEATPVEAGTPLKTGQVVSLNATPVGFTQQQATPAPVSTATTTTLSQKASAAPATATTTKATPTVDATTAALLKNLDVIAKVKEFNAQQQQDQEAEQAESPAAAESFEDEDEDSADFSGMHVVGRERLGAPERSDATLSSDDDDYAADDYDSDTEGDFSENENAAAPVSSSRALVRARPSGGNNIGAFIKAANQVPMLTEEEEKELARRLRDHNDLAAARRLVMSHLRLVVSVARGFAGYNLPLSDLIQEGNIGLMKAVKHFDPDAGGRLAAFAVHWIKAEIHEYVIRNCRMVKVATTKAQRSLFFNLRKLKKHSGWMTEEEKQALAQHLNVPLHEVAVMETRMAGSDIGFDSDESDSDKSGGALTMAPSSYLEDENSNFAQSFENVDYANWEMKKLYEALNTLDERSRYIIKRRWLDEEKATLQELSGELKVSIERVRQLENNAMKKIKALLLHEGVNASDDEVVSSSGVVNMATSAAVAGQGTLLLPKPVTPALTYKPNAESSTAKATKAKKTATATTAKAETVKATKAKSSKSTKASKATQEATQESKAVTATTAKSTKSAPANTSKSSVPQKVAAKTTATAAKAQTNATTAKTTAKATKATKATKSKTTTTNKAKQSQTAAAVAGKRPQDSTQEVTA